MIFGALPLDAVEGALLAHGVTLAGRRHSKGETVSAALVAEARLAGIARLWVARLEAGDVAEAAAAIAIAGAVAGTGVEARAPVHGRVNCHAAHDGLLMVPAEQVTAANRASDAVGIATLPGQTPVRAGDLVATVKVVPFGVPAALVESVVALAPALRVTGWVGGQAALIQTVELGTAAKMLEKTAAVTGARLAALGMGMAELPRVPHDVAALAAAIAACGDRLVLVAGATATADRRDVIPAAIDAAGGTVLRVGMPVDPGNLLVLGRTAAGATVIGLPGCARSPKRNGLDLVLERYAAGLPLDSDGIARMGVGGLLEESGRPVPWGWNP